MLSVSANSTVTGLHCAEQVENRKVQIVCFFKSKAPDQQEEPHLLQAAAIHDVGAHSNY